MVATSLRSSVVRGTTLLLAIAFGLGLILILLWALNPRPAAPARAADTATRDRVPPNSLVHRMSGHLGDAAPSGQSPDLPPGVTAAWWAAVQEQILREASFSGPWTGTGESSNDRFGWSVASAGDVNGDGYADVIVGAPYYDVTPDNDEGKVYVYAGTSSGPGTTPLAKLTGANPDDNFGFCVASAGDVNGDGYGDVIVGAYHHNGYQGAAYVYHGTSTGLNLSPSFTATGEYIGDRFGYSAATAGDVNGDGYADVVIGAHFHSSNAGAVYLYYGSSTGVTHSGVFSGTGDGGEYLGASVATAGDVNGDGYADVIVGAFGHDSNRGRVYVGYGSSSGLNGTDVFSTTGENADDYFGLPVATAGDVNGDGYADVVVGASFHGDGRGAVYIYYGSTGGLSETDVFSVTGEDEDDWFGYSAATAGDVNGDGYADVTVGAFGYDDGAETDAGRAYVYQGGTGGLSATPTLTVTGENQGDHLGASVACAGDVNGDGFTGIVIGADGNSDSASYAGKAYVYYGAGDSLSATPVFAASGESYGDGFGAAVATAGDVNGDGFTDIIVGTPFYDASPALTNTGRVHVYEGSSTGLGVTPAFTATGAAAEELLGYSVATAGDVNGDGYADVVVGAERYDDGRGRVLVYHGSSAGLGATPAFSVTGENNGDEFGGAVASAGDVNGDGYADVVVGAHYAGFDLEGKIYVYHGTSSGLTTTNVYSTTVDEEFAYLGAAVASAGDVNGDGYADVLACATRYRAPGRVYVYHGGSGGLGTTCAVSFTNGITGARFGKSLATAGDVNGDGYADVVIGAEGYMTETGQAYVFHGSGSGLKATPAFTLTGEGVHDRFGRSVATAGDVNGDGYADVVVSAGGYGSSQGRVYVFHGGPSGLSWTDLLSITGQSSAYLGDAVATAGDVNGDAFADVVVGSPFFGTDRGKVTVYHGGGGGRLVRLRQTRSSSGEPLVQPWGMATGLYVRVNGTNPMGRSRLKLQVEACPPGVPFGDAECILYTSLAWEDTTADAYGVPLKEAIGGLSAETLYRWRARLLYAPCSVTEAGITPPPNPAHGPWRRLYGQGLEADLRTPDALHLYLPLVLRNFP
jgi:hypothetical protein